MRTVSIDLGADGTLNVVLCGEIDFSNAAGVTTAVRAAISDGRPRVVRVDVAGVTFLDSSGIGVLVQAMQAAKVAAAQFRVERPCDHVFDQLYITGLVEEFGLAGPVGNAAPEQG